MKEKILVVSGDFDEKGGKPSGFAKKLSESLSSSFDVTSYNGGNYNELENIICSSEGVVLWMPNIPNSYPKLLDKIKTINPKRLLISTKRNDNNKYPFKALIAKALKNKSNLFIEFKSNEGKVVSSLFDPLGNCFIKDESDITVLSRSLSDRVYKLLSCTRIPSIKVGEAIHISETQDMKMFFAYAKDHANTFHKIIHAEDNKGNDRFVGNLSFRCENGFPSFKKDNLIFVSKRNVDKREIDLSSFVAVESESVFNGIHYYGDNKPSVDTPIQVELYRVFPNIKWMLHSHVYIDNAPFTESIIPCGSLEEASEIIKVANTFCVANDANEIFVNLKGHGSIVMASSVETFSRNLNDRYISRNVPEMAKDYEK